MSKFLIAGAAVLMAGNVLAACPAVTGPEAGGIYPHLFEKIEFEYIYSVIGVLKRFI